MFTLRAQQFKDKINELNPSKKWFEVEVEYSIDVSITPPKVHLSLEGADEEFEYAPVVFPKATEHYEGTQKTFEVQGTSEGEVRQRFEGLNNTEGNWTTGVFVGSDYVPEGYEIIIEKADIKVVSVKEMKE